MVTTGMTVIESDFLDSMIRMAREVTDHIYKQDRTPTPDWEQRRWELATRIFANCANQATMETTDVFASFCISQADIFIKEYKTQEQIL